MLGADPNHETEIGTPCPTPVSVASLAEQPASRIPFTPLSAHQLLLDSLAPDGAAPTTAWGADSDGDPAEILVEAAAASTAKPVASSLPIPALTAPQLQDAVVLAHGPLRSAAVSGAQSSAATQPDDALSCAAAASTLL